MADLQTQGDSPSSPFLEESLRLIQEMTNSIRTHVLPSKDCPPPQTRATTPNIHMTNASNAASLRVGSLNIRGKALSSLPELIRMMGVVALDILGLQEVFTSGDIKIPGFTWYGLGGDCGSTKRMRGIGFLIKDSLKSLVTPCTRSLSVHATGPEILWLKLLGKSGTKDTYICNTYVPDENHPYDVCFKSPDFAISVKRQHSPSW
jgi:hypothetical protein